MTVSLFRKGMFPLGSSVSGTPFPLKPWKRDQKWRPNYREHQSVFPVTGNQLVIENEASSQEFLDRRRVIKFMLEMVEKCNSVYLVWRFTRLFNSGRVFIMA